MITSEEKIEFQNLEKKLTTKFWFTEKEQARYMELGRKIWRDKKENEKRSESPFRIVYDSMPSCATSSEISSYDNNGSQS